MKPQDDMQAMRCEMAIDRLADAIKILINKPSAQECDVAIIHIKEALTLAENVAP